MKSQEYEKFMTKLTALLEESFGELPLDRGISIEYLPNNQWGEPTLKVGVILCTGDGETTYFDDLADLWIPEAERGAEPMNWSYWTNYREGWFSPNISAGVAHTFQELQLLIFDCKAFRGSDLPLTFAAVCRAKEPSTGSILDMRHVSSEPGYRVVAPWSPDQLRAAFGTLRPIRAQVEQVEQEGRLLERPVNEGSYIVCYEHPDGMIPREVFFYGRSGWRF